MKKIVYLFAVSVVLAGLFASCASNKELKASTSAATGETVYEADATK